MKEKAYTDTIGTFVFDEDTREPLGIVDDLIINPENLKIEAFILKNTFFKEPKVIKSSSVQRWGKDIFVTKSSIKTIYEIKEVKEILLKEIGIIWKKVVNESGVYVGHVSDFIFSGENSQGIKLIVRKSLFGIFFYGKELLIGKKSIINIKKDGIIIKNINLIKDIA